jgi:internalin A
MLTSRRALLGSFVVATGCAGGPAPPPAPAAPTLSASGPVCAGVEPTTVVSFPDGALARVIRATLQLGDDMPLTCAALARVTTLDAPDAGITSLDGIENLVRLGAFYAYGNNSIRDITPLGHLRALTDLNLARNEIEDIEPIAQVRTLTSLDLYGNPIRDITPIGELAGLVRLRIEYAPGAADVSPLASLTYLDRLELRGNGIVDVSPLAGLTRLRRLALDDNRELRDITPLAGLTNLEILTLGGTAVSDLGPLAHLQRLTSLGLDGTRVFHLGPLLGLAGLSRLDLRGNMQLRDIQPLLFHPTLGEGDGVRLEGTGVSCTDVAALQARGVTVFTTCR